MADELNLFIDIWIDVISECSSLLHHRLCSVHSLSSGLVGATDDRSGPHLGQTDQLAPNGRPTDLRLFHDHFFFFFSLEQTFVLCDAYLTPFKAEFDIPEWNAPEIPVSIDLHSNVNSNVYLSGPAD